MQSSTNAAPSSEELLLMLRKIIHDADDFFTQQQNLLRLSYSELNCKVEQLRYNAQYATLSPSGADRRVHASGGVVPFAVQANGGPAVHSTPLRNKIPASFSTMSTRALPSAVTPPLNASASLHECLVNDAPNAPSTPPSARLPEVQNGEGNKSPSVPAGERFGSDWGSLSGTHNGGLHAESLMASPQSNGRLSLDDLLARFSHADHAPTFNFDNLYEQLTGKEDSSRAAPARGELAEGGGGGASFLDRFTQGDAKTPDVPESEGTSSNDVIPIETLRALYDQHLTTSVKAVYKDGRPTVVPIPGGARDDAAALHVEESNGCQVLVEFKRKRVLQFDSVNYVPPGSYVIVGGDRGEDVGLVIYTCCETTTGSRLQESATPKKQNGGEEVMSLPGKSTVVGIGLADSTLTRNIGVGSGRVLRLATDADVQQLHGVQAELERRAIDVCAQRVLEHGLPMVIVDAEYQFDKKKLTFFYEAQQRMDFRELVRDLYKTFRARIWMELLDS